MIDDRRVQVRQLKGALEQLLNEYQPGTDKYCVALNALLKLERYIEEKYGG